MAAQASAIVVGLCAHGLTLVRDLWSAGVDVVALERDTTLPGTTTRCARLYVVEDINGPALVEALERLARSSHFTSKPVLFLTNDRMVEVAAENVGRLSEGYRLSWALTAPVVRGFLDKRHIEARCREVGLSYPRSLLLADTLSMREQLRALNTPIILKPTRPLSAFKTLIVNSVEELARHRDLIQGSLPVLAQEFIAGDDTHICFGALILRTGQVLARFEGRKLCSRPLGHTTIAISEPNDQVHAMTCRFFAGLQMSGPASLELKRDPDGRYWVIEPTVGRTDFWSGLCTANGVNLPHIEYAAATDMGPVRGVQVSTHVWVNGERHPSALLWLLRNEPLRLFHQSIRGLYLDRRDLGPFWAATCRFLSEWPARAWRKLRFLVGRD